MNKYDKPMTNRLTSLWAMLIACRNWIASPVVFMMLVASEVVRLSGLKTDNK